MVAAPLALPLAAAFVAGLAGSVHCVAMCGGIAGALGLWARRCAPHAGGAALHAACHQLGRVASYTLAGALCGAFGATLIRLFRLESLVFAARIAGGLLLMAIAMRVLTGWQLTAPIERLGARLWSRIVPRLGRLQPHGLGGSLLLGMGWGWLPCGLVYSMLVYAATTGSALRGAATMALFGVGTWPMLLAGGLLSGQAARWSTARGVHAVAGVLLLGFGILTLYGPLAHGRGHVPFCYVP